MGKSKKSRRVAIFRSDPIKAESSNGVEVNNGLDGQIVNTSVIETIEAQLSSGQCQVALEQEFSLMFGVFFSQYRGQGVRLLQHQQPLL